MSRRSSLIVLGLVPVLAFAACTGATTSTSSPAPTSALLATATPLATPSPTPTLAPTATPSPSAAPPASGSQSGVPTSIDPCQLVTAAEASTLAATTYASGKAETTPGGAKTCVYGAQTTNVFTVLVAVAPDAATAQVDWAANEALAQSFLSQGLPSGFSVASFGFSLVSNVAGADRAEVGTETGSSGSVTINASAIYALKGAAFFSFTDLVLGKPGPSISAVETQAVTSLARLP